MFAYLSREVTQMRTENFTKLFLRGGRREFCESLMDIPVMDDKVKLTQ